MPSLIELLQLPSNYQMLDMSLTPTVLQVTIASESSSAPCPRCQTPSTSRHSTYTRTLRDLTWGQRSIHFLVHTHKWRCRVASCSQRIFAERLTPLAERSERYHQMRTLRDVATHRPLPIAALSCRPVAPQAGQCL